jgi:hypothetical protein
MVPTLSVAISGRAALRAASRVAQAYAEAALSPALAAIVAQQLATRRGRRAAPERHRDDAANLAEAFVAVCVGYNQQLAVRGDLDPAPFTEALIGAAGLIARAPYRTVNVLVTALPPAGVRVMR